MTTFTWKILSLSCLPEAEENQNVVNKVRWICSATNNGQTAVSDGIANIQYDSDKTFIPYNNLSEEDVLNWVKSQVGKEDIENNLQTMIDSQVSETSTELPWSVE